jgi:dihydroxyacid dehydratase/phosphogluconate dehydratase
MLALYRAGGIPAVLAMLKRYLDDAPTVSGPLNPRDRERRAGSPTRT